MFSIDRFSGKITLAQSLDHERQQQYTLRVQASDMAHITETSITVNVLDENDNAPVFSTQSYHASLPGTSIFIYYTFHIPKFPSMKTMKFNVYICDLIPSSCIE